MSNSNGQFVLQALEMLGQPATMNDIASTVAKSCGMTVGEVRETVKQTLNGGLKHGYVKYSNRKYSAVNYDADEADSIEKKDPIKTNKDEQPGDAPRARRRSRSSSRRRKRSVSRRSRSRRRISNR